MYLIKPMTLGSSLWKHIAGFEFHPYYQSLHFNPRTVKNMKYYIYHMKYTIDFVQLKEKNLQQYGI